MLCTISRENKISSIAQTEKENTEERKIHEQEIAWCPYLMEMIKEIFDNTLNALTLSSKSMSALNKMKSEANGRSNFPQAELLRYTKLGK